MPPATTQTDGSLAYTYEAVFCIFLVTLAFLGRDHVAWNYPGLLGLLVALLALNLGAALALKRWSALQVLSAGVALANCAVISGILHASGGRESRLWVLYLLPVFSASLFLERKELLLITAGAVGFNAAFFLAPETRLDAATALDLGLRSGILVLAAVLTWRLADRERGARRQLATQRHELEDLLERAQSREPEDGSAKRLAEIGLVAAGVLHDLKTPLTVILGFSEIGRMATEPRQMRQDFERIRSAGLVCRDIVSQVLAISGGARPALSPCDLRETLLGTFRMCEGVFGGKGIAVKLELPEDPILIAGASSRLQRLFLNLFTNASQALGRGGLLKISASFPGDGRIEVSFEDDGPGLSPEALARLFKPFSTTRSASGGTGLGLYISRDIALSHGGDLQAANRPEGGARFTVILPLPRPAPVAGA